MKKILSVFFMVSLFSCESPVREAFASLRKIDAAIDTANRLCDEALRQSESEMDEENDRQIWAREIIAAERCAKEFTWAESEISVATLSIPMKAERHVALGKIYLRAAGSFLALWKQRVKCLSIPDRDDSLEEDYECAEVAEKFDGDSSSLLLRAKTAYKLLTGSRVAKGGEK